LALAAEDADEDGLVIGVRQPDQPKPAKKEERKDAPGADHKLSLLLDKDLGVTKFEAEAMQIVKLLADPKTTQDQKDDLAIAISRDATRAAKTFGGFLNWSKVPDPKLRLAVLEAINLAYTGSGVGGYLGASAMSDPDARVRATAVKLIKDRNDRTAVRYVFQNLLKALENGENAPVIDEDLYKASIAALREIGDKQVYEVLLFFDKLTLLNGITGTSSLEPVKVAAPRTDLPVTVVQNEIGFMQYVKTIPGLQALKAISGEDFGHNHKKWQEWIDQQPAYRP
jgi:hypothetical protein